MTLRVMRLNRRRSLHLYEPEVDFDQPGTDHATGESRKWRLRFWVARPPECGGNRAGNCSDLTVTRSDTLIIHEEGGVRRYFAAGTWTEAMTETRRGPSTSGNGNGTIGES